MPFKDKQLKKECDKRYRQEHSREIKELKRAWYLRNKEHCKTVSKEWVLQNREKYLKNRKGHYMRNRDNILNGQKTKRMVDSIGKVRIPYWLGKSLPEHIKNKIRLAHKDKALSAQHKANISHALKKFKSLNSKQVEISCKNCKKLFNTYPSLIKRKYPVEHCSFRCQKEFRQSRSIMRKRSPEMTHSQISLPKGRGFSLIEKEQQDG